MTDRELLELAAKAADIRLGGETDTGYAIAIREKPYVATWNPLTDDGDALRTAVKLKIPMQFPDWSNVTRTWGERSGAEPYDELHEDDPYAATRRAIVRAAAEIGKQMP